MEQLPRGLELQCCRKAPELQCPTLHLQERRKADEYMAIQQAREVVVENVLNLFDQ